MGDLAASGVPLKHRSGGWESEGRPWKINWNAALDLWLTIEIAALLLMMLVSGTIFSEWSSFHFQSFALGGVAWIGTFATLSWYRRSAQPGRPTPAIATQLSDWVKASLIMVLASFLLKSGEEYSRAWAITMFVSGGGVIALIAGAGRNAIFSLAERKGLIGDRIAIYGCEEGTDRLIRTIESRSGPLAHVSGLFDQRGDRAPEMVDGRPVSRDIQALLAEARAGQIDAVMLNLPWSATARIQELVHRLEQVNVDILLAPAAIQTQGNLQFSMKHVGPVPTLSLYQRPMTGIQAAAKILFDRTVAALALLFLLPLLLAIAAAIKLDSAGPVLFRQKRCGMNNIPFEMFKFRSMYTHSEDKNADRLVVRGDDRITKVGRFLRKTSLDELPQLMNVLMGSMSLVGPRPHAYGAKAADRLYEDVVQRYAARHRVLPGLTGLAQVRGFRGNTGDEADILNRVASDLEYIERWSLSLDFAILGRTALTVLLQPNAY